MPAKQRTKYGWTHDKISAELRAHWTADPTTRCAFCHLTLAEGEQRYGPERARWVADHPNGRTDLGYRPAHHTCNSADGARQGRARNHEPTSETW